MNPETTDALNALRASGGVIIAHNPETGEAVHVPDPDGVIRRALDTEGYHVKARAEGNDLHANITIQVPPMDPLPYMLAGLGAGTARRRGRGSRTLTPEDIMHRNRKARRRRATRIAKASRRRNRV